MEKKLTLRTCFFMFAFMVGMFPFYSHSQDLTGIWRGYFITEDGEQYKYELQIEQSKTNHISGVSYSYLDTRFYGKALLTGNFSKNGQSALVQEIKTVEVKMASGSVACIMKCIFNLTTSGKESFLEGSYSSTFETGVARGKNCGGGKIFLRKVPTSDFYIEPFLRNKTPEPEKDTEQKKPTVQAPAKPAVKKPAVSQAHKPAVKPKTNTQVKPPVKKQTTVKKRQVPVLRDTIALNHNAPITLEKPDIKPLRLPAVTRSRENELVKTITVSNEQISVRLYDNGEIDGDTISVYLDGKPIVTNKGLSTIPITVNLKMDEANPDHTLVMVAENLGSIPPNTSLMIVQDGDNRYQVAITSTEQKNAMVRFRYQKK